MRRRVSSTNTIILGILLAAASATDLAAQTADAELETADKLINEGRHEEAVTALRRCLALEPNHPVCLVFLGAELALQFNRYQEALPVARAAVTHTARPPFESLAGPAHTVYAIVLQNVGDSELAIKHLAQAEKLLPEDHNWRDRLIWTKVGATFAMAEMTERLQAKVTAMADAAERLQAGGPAPVLTADSSSADFAAKVATHRDITAYKITEVIQPEDGGWLVRIESDSIDWLSAGQEGSLFAIARPADGVSPSVIGTAVIQNGGNNATVLVRPSEAEGEGERHRVREGDLVIVGSAFRWEGTPSVLLSLARLNITFTARNQKEPLLNPRVARIFDEFATPAIVLARMARVIRDTAAGVRANPDRYASLLQPLPRGPYEGLSTVEVMERATVKDVLEFLYFVESLPSPYMGTAIPIDDAFGTWVHTWTSRG